jgi:hypothetical protein
LGCSESVESSCHVLRSWTHFVVVPRALGPVFMFSEPGEVYDGTEGVGYRFHLLRSRRLFRRYRGYQVLFAFFALPDSFCAVPMAPGPVFMSCAPGPVLGCSRASSPVFMFCALGRISGSTEGVESCFHVLRSRTHFRRCRGRQVRF